MWLLCIIMSFLLYCVFFFKQKTAYEMRISDWSSDVCSSDLGKALSEKASRDVKVLVVGNPANTNALIAQSNAKKLDPKQFTAMVQIGRASCRERVCQYV